jgi:hypothetical protein
MRFEVSLRFPVAPTTVDELLWPYAVVIGETTKGADNMTQVGLLYQNLTSALYHGDLLLAITRKTR